MYKDMPDCSVCHAENMGIVFVVGSGESICVECFRKLYPPKYYRAGSAALEHLAANLDNSDR